ncbi:GIY-YIG nuclease family protein [Candidatus Daviesbacteria bacterium]|nr:GIY-YIG nuclease family protein [Candidatus Daviesbacteria bacterium]
MYFVYSIYNVKHKKIYIGQTKDLPRRLREHNDPECLRHTYTRRFDGLWELIYKEELSSRSGALLREKQLKSYQGRLFIKNHIPR